MHLKNTLNYFILKKQLMSTIKDGNYNAARKILIEAGSKTAEKAHPQHTSSGSCPRDYGIKLINEAGDEFTQLGYTKVHEKAIAAATKKMGLVSRT